MSVFMIFYYLLHMTTCLRGFFKVGGTLKIGGHLSLHEPNSIIFDLNIDVSSLHKSKVRQYRVYNKGKVEKVMTKFYTHINIIYIILHIRDHVPMSHMRQGRKWLIIVNYQWHDVIPAPISNKLVVLIWIYSEILYLFFS